MKLNFHNSPTQGMLDSNLLPQEQPTFLTHQPDLNLIKKVTEKYQNYKNILVIGHGGSVTSFYGIYGALANTLNPSQPPLVSSGGDSDIPPLNIRGGQGEFKFKNAYFLSTIDPDYIAELKNKLSPKDTLVLAISKSGQDTTQPEALSQFWDYKILVITGENTPLYQIAQQLNLEIVAHPPIGGRFTGLTEVALLPAAICGIDIENIFAGGRTLYEKFNTDNEAWQLASVLFELEQNGIIDVFVPIYSHYLNFFSPLITQLAHESFGKENLGQTFLCMEGPEWQHHSLQRFLGGRKNAAALFISVKNNSGLKNNFEGIADIQIKTANFGDLNNLTLKNNLQIERQAQIESISNARLPVIDLEMDDLNAKTIGSFLAFWQMFAVYSAILRDVNPFDQPEVEAGKQISFQKRLSVKP